MMSISSSHQCILPGKERKKKKKKQLSSPKYNCALYSFILGLQGSFSFDLHHFVEVLRWHKHLDCFFHDFENLASLFDQFSFFS